MDPKFVAALRNWGLTQAAVDAINQVIDQQHLSADEQTRFLYALTQNAAAADINKDPTSATQNAVGSLPGHGGDLLALPKAAAADVGNFIGGVAGAVGNVVGGAAKALTPGPGSASPSGPPGSFAAARFAGNQQSQAPKPIADAFAALQGGASPTPGSSTDPAAGATGTSGTGTGASAPVPPGTPYMPNWAQYEPVSAFSYSGKTDVASLAALAGTDAATFTKLYNDYAGHIATMQNRLQSHVGVTDQPAHQIPTMSMQDFAANRAAAMQGQWQPVLDAMDYNWNANYGTRMPGALRAQMLAALNGLDQNQQKAILIAEMSYVQGLTNAKSSPSGISGSIAALSNTLQGVIPQSITVLRDRYAALNTDSAKQAYQNQLNIVQAFQSTLHRQPTAADEAALGANPTDAEITTYINNQPLTDDPKVRYGEYAAVQKFVDPLYNTYFGGPASPSQLMSYMGMNQQQITDHIMASPSTQLPGETVGRYVQLKGFADSLVSKIGYGVSDQVIAAAHKGMVSGG